MRMMFLAVLAFLLAGISIALSRQDLLSVVSRHLFPEPVQLVFEPETNTDQDDALVSLVRARPDGVLLLNRASPNQTAHYQMLQDASVASGVLNLRATAQIDEGQTSALRVFVGNEVRADILLHPGQQSVDAEIGLTSDDLARDVIAIRYVMTTPDTEGACTSSNTWANVVEIEQSTHISLDTDGGRLSPRDQVAAWGNEILIGWPNWLPADQRQSRASLGLQLGVLGYSVRYLDAPNSVTMSTQDLEALVASGPSPFIVEAARPEWPESVGGSAANAGLRTFHGSTEWRHWYRIGPNDHATTPLAFEYELLLGTLPNGSNWSVAFTHNGSIVDLIDVSGQTRTLRGEVSLEGLDFDQTNVMAVTAISDYEPTGLCNDGPELLAELRSSSQLVGDGGEADDGLSDLELTLLSQQPVSVAIASDLSLVEVQRVHDIVARLLPPRHVLSFEQDQAMITSVRTADFDSIIPTLPEDSYVAWVDDADRLRAVQAPALQEGGEDWPSGAVALIIAPTASGSTQQVQLR